MDLAEFINAHLGDDPVSLALHRDRWPGVDIALAADCITAKRKLRNKVAEWYADARLLFPSPLSAEQCSSTLTARHKAGLALAFGGRKIADLTGGLGVDAWQFSEAGASVLYNETDRSLSEAVKRNFALLGMGRKVKFSNLEISAGNLGGLLDGFGPDLVFIDPARRGSEGRKVFRLEDCSPNLAELQDIVLGRGIRLMAKLSPFADISLLGRSLHHLKEIHIVEATGECKEILALCEPGFDGEFSIVAEEACGVVRFEFRPSEEAAAAMAFCKQLPSAGAVLFEPGPALMKSGAYRLLCCRFGLSAIGKDAHFYLTGNLPAPEGLGRRWRIVDSAPFNKSAIRDFASKYPGCDSFIARGLPLRSEELAAAFATSAKTSASARKEKGKLFALAGTAGKLLLYCVDERDNNYI